MKVRISIEYEIDDDIKNYEDEAYRLFEEEFGTKILDTDSISNIEIIKDEKFSMTKAIYEKQLTKILNSKSIDINDLRSLNDKLYFYIINEFEKK